MVVELLKKQENFTNSEKQVAEYLLKNPFYVSNLNASELGDRTYTSKATVFRLCKKIGIYSFEELKKALDREMREKEHLDSLLAKEPFHKNSSIADIVNILPSFYDTAINNTKLRINQNSIARIVRQINEAEKIDIYSSGITSTCAKTAQFKFMSAGKECVVHSSVNEHYVMANRNKKTVAILLSFTGCNPGMVRVAKYLKRLKYDTVGIGGVANRELLNLCDEYIEIYQDNLLSNFEMMTPYISMTYIFDILFVAVVTKNYDKNLINSIEVKKLGDIIKDKSET